MKSMRKPLIISALIAVIPSSVALAQQAIPHSTVEEQERDSDSSQPISDAWITTKVKSELAVADDVSAMDITVETTNGVVKLSGSVDDLSRKEKAVDVAGRVKGVNRVDATELTVER